MPIQLLVVLTIWTIFFQASANEAPFFLFCDSGNNSEFFTIKMDQNLNLVELVGPETQTMTEEAGYPGLNALVYSKSSQEPGKVYPQEYFAYDIENDIFSIQASYRRISAGAIHLSTSILKDDNYRKSVAWAYALVFPTNKLKKIISSQSWNESFSMEAIYQYNSRTEAVLRIIDAATITAKEQFLNMIGFPEPPPRMPLKNENLQISCRLSPIA